jgi:hypothetical protein
MSPLVRHAPHKGKPTVENDCHLGSYIRSKEWKLGFIMFKRFDERAFEEINAVLNA